MKRFHAVSVTLVVLLVTLGVFGGTAAASHDSKDSDHEEPLPDAVADDAGIVGEDGAVSPGAYVPDGGVIGGDNQKIATPRLVIAFAGTGKAAATRVRKAFLTAKKAFHEARQEIQAIKKGEKSPVEDVPTFFEGEDDDGDGSEGEN